MREIRKKKWFFQKKESLNFYFRIIVRIKLCKMYKFAGCKIFDNTQFVNILTSDASIPILKVKILCSENIPEQEAPAFLYKIAGKIMGIYYPAFFIFKNKNEMLLQINRIFAERKR